MSLEQPTQVDLTSLKLGGKDVMGLFQSVEIFENIHIGGVTGSVVIIDSDSINFIKESELEFIEEIEFEFKNALDQSLKFKGFMNGITDENVQSQKRMYIIDFTSEAVRKNEMKFISEAYNNVAPEEIVKKMIEEELEAELESKGQGEPLSWVAGNKKPLDVIKYVLSHGISGESDYSGEGEKDGKSEGTNGFLCWETLKGYRFCSLDQLQNEPGLFGEMHTDYVPQVSNTGGEMETRMKSIAKYDFPQVGDYFKKLRSGAFANKYVSYDTDTGKLTTFQYKADEEQVTQKQLEYLDSDYTRVVVKQLSNEKHNNTCEKAQKDTGDQSRKTLQQSIARENTFDDTQGRITLPPNFEICAGEHIELKIPKRRLSEQDEMEYEEKHSGRYLISQVGHFVDRNGAAYTKLSIVRTAKQIDEETTQ